MDTRLEPKPSRPHRRSLPVGNHHMGARGRVDGGAPACGLERCAPSGAATGLARWAPSMDRCCIGRWRTCRLTLRLFLRAGRPRPGTRSTRCRLRSGAHGWRSGDLAQGHLIAADGVRTRTLTSPLGSNPADGRRRADRQKRRTPASGLAESGGSTVLVGAARLELARTYVRSILSRLRLPFRHAPVARASLPVLRAATRHFSRWGAGVARSLALRRSMRYHAA